MIELRKLTKAFTTGQKRQQVLSKISYTFRVGRFYGIMGQSGVGKSTLMNIIAGLEEPSSGAVLFDGVDIVGYDQAQLLCNKIGVMFQYPHLVPELTVIENVALKGIIAGMSFQDRTARALELLHAVGLADKKDQDPMLLSGGEQQRIALIRALFLRTTFLLADEPTAHLDAQNSYDILQLIKKFQCDYDMGVIVSSHDSSIKKMANTVLTLINGDLQENILV